MPRGKFPSQYVREPHVAKPISDIYADIDNYTYEIFADETHAFDAIDFIVALPPVTYEGRFLKGMFYSHGVDVICDAIPEVRYLFNTFSYSMWSSYPWAKQADAALVCYRNPARESWYIQQNPERAGTALLPLQDADYTHEYKFAPAPVPRKDIDLLCVSRLSEVKNLTMIAQALKLYRQKFPFEPIRMTLITGNKGGYSEAQLGIHARQQLKAIERILGRPEDYIDFVPHVDHWRDMPLYYSRSRAFVLGSLIEGKNRSINEALSCNVPVICFREHNQFARQGFPIFPEGAGLYAAYDPESLADTIQAALTAPEAFSPRQCYLRMNGRRNFVNQCVDALAYYRTALPDYKAGSHTENVWLDVAVQHNYQISLRDFLYNNQLGIAYVSGLDRIRHAVRAYGERFDH